MIKKRYIREIAVSNGFDLCAVIRPGMVAGFDKFSQWLHDGCHADMKWLENNFGKRCDTRLIMEDCQSIIVLGVSYFNGDNINDGNNAIIARYAWGDDYHDVLQKKLKIIIEKIKNIYTKNSPVGAIPRGRPNLVSTKGDRKGRPYDPNPQFKFYTDTGPILEKNLGAMAGLGWIGKNSLLINHKIGSYFFMATIFTNLEIEEFTEESMGSCGTCRKCIDACPTGAIREDRTINCRKCISYHTIENKGQIPPEIKDKMNNRVFGCDICQEVCPWNRFAKQTRLSEFETKNNRDKLTMEQIRNMDREEYQRLFKNSAVKRAKFEGLKRNVGLS